jgi:hypothetical protein
MRPRLRAPPWPLASVASPGQCGVVLFPGKLSGMSVQSVWRRGGEAGGDCTTSRPWFLRVLQSNSHPPPGLGSGLPLRKGGRGEATPAGPSELLPPTSLPPWLCGCVCRSGPKLGKKKACTL